MHERATWLADLVRRGQADGEIDAALSPHAVAHLCLSLAVGTALVGPDVDLAGLAPIRTADPPGSRP